jgi:hypothetical protein
MDLPNEIIREICDRPELKRNDLPSLRLTCKRLCESALRHFGKECFSEITVLMTYPSIQAFSELAQHRSLLLQGGYIYTRNFMSLIAWIKDNLTHLVYLEIWKVWVSPDPMSDATGIKTYLVRRCDDMQGYLADILDGKHEKEVQAEDDHEAEQDDDEAEQDDDEAEQDDDEAEQDDDEAEQDDDEAEQDDNGTEQEDNGIEQDEDNDG